MAADGKDLQVHLRMDPGIANDLTILKYNNAELKKFPTSASRLADFFNEYCKVLRGGDLNNLKYGELIEKNELPLIGNFVFHFSEQNDIYYTDELISTMVKCYQNVISMCFENADDREDHFKCVVLISDTDRNREPSLHIRLQFPYCKVDRKFYSSVVRNAIISELTRSDAINYFTIVPNGGWEGSMKDFDKSVPLYGSMNDDNFAPIFDSIYTLDGKPYEREDFFDPEESYFISSGRCDGNFASDFSSEELLPIFLSIYFCNDIMKPKRMKKEATTKKHVPYVDIDDENISNDDPKTMFGFLINLLNPYRAEEENFWLDVGRCIFNIFDGSEEGLDEWKKFTLKGSRNPRECDTQYIVFGNNPGYLTIKTIAWYAREDNPEHYQLWHSKWTEVSLDKALTQVHREVAEAFYRIFWLDFIYCSRTESKWFRFNGVFLRPCDDEIVKKYISKHFSDVYVAKQIEKNEEALEAEGRRRKNLLEDVKYYNQIVSKLGDESYQNKILKQARQHFICENFHKIYDADPKKIACNNCVIEVTSTKAVTRSGKLEDFITKSTEVRYPRKYSWKSPEVIKVLKIFSQIMVEDQELIEWFWRFNASILRGRNNDKIFPICPGCGDNGKTIYAKFLQYGLGSYSVDMPVETISGKGGRAGEARADLAQAQGTRVATVLEPSENNIQTSVIKKFSGNDRQWCRTLFDKGGAMEQLYKLILLCNDIPHFSHVEKALISRVLIIPFLALFSIEAPEDPTEQRKQRCYPMDPTLEDQIPDLAPAFLWICVQYFPKYVVEGIKTRPKIVSEYTQNYWKRHDYYRCFMEECLRKTEDGSLTSTELVKAFREWFEENNGRGTNKQLLQTSYLITKFTTSEYLGPWENRRWKGWKLIVMEK